jgi:hypothetical protein
MKKLIKLVQYLFLRETNPCISYNLSISLSFLQEEETRKILQNTIYKRRIHRMNLILPQQSFTRLKNISEL